MRFSVLRIASWTRGAAVLLSTAPNASPASPAQLSELSKPGLPRVGGGAANEESALTFPLPVLWAVGQVY